MKQKHFNHLDSLNNVKMINITHQSKYYKAIQNDLLLFKNIQWLTEDKQLTIAAYDSISIRTKKILTLCYKKQMTMAICYKDYKNVTREAYNNVIWYQVFNVAYTLNDSNAVAIAFFIMGLIQKANEKLQVEILSEQKLKQISIPAIGQIKNSFITIEDMKGIVRRLIMSEVASSEKIINAVINISEITENIKIKEYVRMVSFDKLYGSLVNIHILGITSIYSKQYIEHLKEYMRTFCNHEQGLKMVCMIFNELGLIGNRPVCYVAAIIKEKEAHTKAYNSHVLKTLFRDTTVPIWLAEKILRRDELVVRLARLKKMSVYKLVKSSIDERELIQLRRFYKLNGALVENIIAAQRIDQELRQLPSRILVDDEYEYIIYEVAVERQYWRLKSHVIAQLLYDRNEEYCTFIYYLVNNYGDKLRYKCCAFRESIVQGDIDMKIDQISEGFMISNVLENETQNYSNMFKKSSMYPNEEDRYIPLAGPQHEGGACHNMENTLILKHCYNNILTKAQYAAVKKLIDVLLLTIEGEITVQIDLPTYADELKYLYRIKQQTAIDVLLNSIDDKVIALDMIASIKGFLDSNVEIALAYKTALPDDDNY